MSNVRKTTNTLIELAEQGFICLESIATTCRLYMSEDDLQTLLDALKTLQCEAAKSETLNDGGKKDDE